MAPNKEKLKQILEALSTPEEKDKLREFEMQKEVDKKLDSILNGLEKSVNSSKESNVRVSKTIMETFNSFVDKLGEKLDDLKGTVAKNRPENAAPVYKDMINQISAVKESIDKKPVPVWNWPQYASVGVRDKSFSNIDPSLAYQHNTSTPSAPYGTTLAYDSSGTIKVVSSTNPLPVNASVTATIDSVGMSGLNVKISKADTAVLSGIRVFQQNSPSVNVTSSTQSGLQVNLKQIKGIAVSVSNGTTDTGTQRVTLSSDSTGQVVLAAGSASIGKLGSNDGVDIGDVTINNASGGSAVNIQDGGNSITVDFTTSTQAGLRVFVNNPATAPVPVNLNTVTTSALAGIKVQIKPDSPTMVTTAVVGIATSASGDTKLIPAQGAGKKIYVYAFDLSFNGSVNAKFADGLTSKLLSGLYYGVANSGAANSVSPNFLQSIPSPDLFHTAANSALYINLSGSTAVGGRVSYYVV